MASIMGAMIRAIVAWMFVYVAVAHLYVYWNWNATDGTHHDAMEASTSIMDEAEVQAILAEIPLEPIALIDLRTTADPVPEELAPLDSEFQERVQALNTTHSLLEAEVAALQTQAQEWHYQKMALEQATSEVRAATQRLQQLLDSSNKPDNIWNVISTRLEQYDNDTATDPWSIDGTRPSEAAELWQELMEHVTDLNKLTNVELDRTMERIIDALDDQIQYAADISWKQLTEACRRTDYPTKRNSPVFDTCPVPPDVVVVTPEKTEVEPTTDEEDESALLTEDHVLERLEELRDIWYEAFEEDVPLVLAPGRERMATLRKELVSQWTEKAKTHVMQSLEQYRSIHWQQPSSSESGDNCLHDMEVASYVLEAGLNALERKTDVNSAILNAFMDNEYNVRQIILDAVLLEEAENAKSSGSSSAAASSWTHDNQVSLTWRQVLDQPLTKTVTNSWLPFWVDVIGGYNDALDTWLDSTYSSSGVGGENEVFQRLLELAGNHPLPQSVRNYWFASQRRR